MEEKITRKVNKKTNYSQKPDKQTKKLTEKCKFCQIKPVEIKLTDGSKACRSCYQLYLSGLTAETIKFNGTFRNSELLTEFSCHDCQQAITVIDISEKNYSLLVSDNQNQITKDEYGERIFYGLNFWLKAVNHKFCPPQKDKPNFTTQERTIGKPLTQLYC